MPDEEADYLRVTHPFATNIRRCPFDLHVLGTPPAFVLSQDQTLQYIEESLTQKINEVMYMKQCSVMKGRRIRDGVYNKLLEIVCQQIFFIFFKKSLLH